MKYKEYIIASGGLLLICLLLFNKVLFSGYDFLGGDSYSAKAVEQGFSLAEEKYGETPLWLPWMLSGLPSVHSFQNIQDHYYPYKVFEIFRNLGLLRFYEFIFHFVFAGLGMIMLLRNLKCNFMSSIFGAVSYMTMPYLIANLVHGHGSLMMTATYIPWIMWALLNLFQRKNLLSMGILGLLLGFQLQRAHVQIAYYTWMMVGLYVLFYIIKSIYNKDNNFISKSNPLFFLSGSLVLGIALAASIYLPAMSYTAHSIRGVSEGGMGLANAMNYSFPPIESIVFIIPSFFGFGDPMYWGEIKFTAYPQYMGVIVLIFAIYGYIKSSKKIKYFFMTVSIFALLIAFGRHFDSFYRLFYNYLPFFNKFRVPMFILILFQFSTCVLAGIGFNHFLNKIKDNNINFHKDMLFKILVITMTLIGSIFLFRGSLTDFSNKWEKLYENQIKRVEELRQEGQITEKVESYNLNLIKSEIDKGTKEDSPTQSSLITFDILVSLIILLLLYCIIQFTPLLRISLIMPVLIILISLIDIWIVNYKIINPNDNKYRISPLTERKHLEAYLKKDEVIDFFNQDSSKYRISFIVDPELPSRVIQNAASSNRWAAFNIENSSGFHPAKLSRYDDSIIQKLNSHSYFIDKNIEDYCFKESIDNRHCEIIRNRYPANDPLMKTLNIKYLISSQKFSPNKYWELMNESALDMMIQRGTDSVYIYLYKEYYDRLYFSQEQVVLDSKVQKEALSNINFNPRIVSLVSKTLPEKIEFDPTSEVSMIDWTPNKITFKTNTKSKQFLNISEIYYPIGWVVTNDKNKDENIEIYEVNSLIRGIIVDAGENTYTMEYKPSEVKTGSIVSFISFLILCLLIIIGFRNENKK